MNQSFQLLLYFVGIPAIGVALGGYFASSRVLSGKVALVLSALAPAGAGLTPVFCQGHPLSWLGPSLVLGGLPMAFVYSDQAWGRAPDRTIAKVALTLTLLEGAGRFGLIAWSAVSR